MLAKKIIYGVAAIILVVGGITARAQDNGALSDLLVRKKSLPIIDGRAGIGMSSRRAKPAEISAASGKGVNMKPTIVAYDGIAVIVNAANPIKGLTRKQVEQICHRRSDRLERRRRRARQDLDLHPQHFLVHVFRL